MPRALASSRCVEIRAEFRGTVIDARQLRPSTGRPRSTRWWLLGSVLLTLGLAWFGSQTFGQAQAWSEFEHAAALASMRGDAPPAAPGSAWGVLGLFAALAGLVPLMLGLVRTTERDPSRYSIGEGAGASVATPPVDLVTPGAFELVRVGAGGAVGLRFTETMQGEISVGQQRWSLQEWVQAGRTVADGVARGTTLPPGAGCWLTHAGVRVSLQVVAAAEAPSRTLEVEWPLVASTAGAFVVLSALMMLAQMLAPTSDEFALEERMAAARFVSYASRPTIAALPVPATPAQEPTKPLLQPAPNPATPVPAPLAEAVADVADRAPRPTWRPQPSPRRTGPTGAPRMGSLAKASGLMQRGTSPLDAARTAGVLAMVDTASLGDSPAAKAFSPDADDREMWEAMASRDVMSKSVAGLSLVGTGRGGGPDAAESLAHVASDDVPYEEVTERSLIVKVGRGTARGPMGRDAIRRVVVRHVRDLRRCYDAGVDRNASLRGDVTLTLEIVGRGEVTAKVARGRFSDPVVADCIATAARRWRFVPPTTPRRSQATFEITLRPG